MDLNHRLLRYPCSYLIYSAEFNALPDLCRDFVYRRMWEVLSGTDKSDDFRNLSDSDRSAIREILAETKPDFAAFRPQAVAGHG
jgi:hypothetical protein